VRIGTASSWIVAYSAILACALPIRAQQLRDGPGGEPPLDLPRISGGIDVDGVLDEPQWANAVRLEGVQQVPDFGAPPTQRGEFLLAHDGEYLYLGCLMYESDPSLIRITTLQRDVSPYTTDTCGMRLDSYNDEENSLVFVTTPASVRTDWQFANDATGAPNRRWDTYWDAEGRLTEFGWSAEVRVPFSSMGYQVVDGRVVMGFSVTRTMVRSAESIVHPAIRPDWGPGGVAKPTQMRKMIITGLDDPQKPVYVTPYVLGGGGLATGLDASGTGYDRDTHEVRELGGDLRYALTRNLNLDLSVNTDFAQVEADNQQVNLTRFSLFFPEQRQFFQERSGIFEVSLGSNERLFHSRRIGLVDGSQIPIYGGARIVGRVGDWDVGFLNMQAADEGPTPSENLGVVRLRRRFLNNASYLGGIVTSRIGDDGSSNVLYGMDASVRVFSQNYLTVNWSQSFSDTDPGTVGVFDRSLTRLNWQRRGTDGPTYEASMVRAGADFEPGMGFLRRRNYLRGFGSAGYGWRPGAGSALNRFGFALNGSFVRRNEDGSAESRSYGLSGSLQTRGGHNLRGSVTRSYEDLVRPLFLSADASVLIDDYWFTDAQVSFTPSAGGLFRPSGSVTAGHFYDGNRVSFNFTPAWSVSRHARLSATYQLNRIDFSSRDVAFTSHIVRARTEFTLSTKTSFSAFVQYNSSQDLVAVNARFRYNPREGNDLYIVWNESLNSDRFSLAPVPPLTRERVILVKYSHTLTMGL
jgi:hypothetical protein